MRDCDSWTAMEAPVRQRQARQRAVDAHFIQCMPGLVHGAKQSRVDPVGIHAGGDAHIADAKIGAEWMDGLILATVIPVIPKASNDINPKSPLLFFRERLVQERVIHLGRSEMARISSTCCGRSSLKIA
jgi:hypothetical protein